LIVEIHAVENSTTEIQIGYKIGIILFLCIYLRSYISLNFNISI